MLFCLIAQITQDSATVKTITENAENFEKIDPMGIGMTAIGMSVVFTSLLLLYILFFNITKLINLKLKRSLRKGGKEADTPGALNISSEVDAAIALALHMYFQEVHDYENTVLTINKVSRTYSPWSSKIYGLRQYPKK